jgi:hypothetical protein
MASEVDHFLVALDLLFNPEKELCSGKEKPIECEVTITAGMPSIL